MRKEWTKHDAGTKTNKITSRKLLLLFVIIANACFLMHSQASAECPYGMFGDNTPVLDIERSKESSPGWQCIVVSDSMVAIATIVENTIVIRDNNDVISTFEINPNSRALFTTMDPKANEAPWISPIAYCHGNPVNYVDPDGQRPSDYESALLCLVSYVGTIKDYVYSNAIQELNRLNWTRSDIGNSLQLNHPAGTGIGLQSMVFERITDGVTEYAYVIAGTNSWEDGVEDVIQIFCLSSMHTAGIKNIVELDKLVGDNELTLLGHSAGGMIAAAGSMLSGRDAITFNTAAMGYATKFMLSFSPNQGNITNFISSTPNFLGLQLTVDPISILQSLVTPPPPGKCLPISIGFKMSHGIENIVKSYNPTILIKK